MNTLNIFAQEINALANVVNANDIRLQKKVAETVVNFVANSTPLDTGQASSNWKTTIDAPSAVYDPGAAQGPSVSIADCKIALAALTPGHKIHIVNNVPYIVKLNQGSSQQAPAAFVELSIVSALNVSGKFNLLVK